MSETNMNAAGSMYDSVTAIHELNSIAGFDPRNYMRMIGEGKDNARYYLDVAFRKLWFRLKYPEGKISKRLLKLTEDMAVVEARVYLNYKDNEEDYVANAFSHKFKGEDAQFGAKFVEFAETAAIGRALADAGFGLQFADWEKELDPEVTDAPFEPDRVQGKANAATYTADISMGAMDDAGTVIDENNLPGQHQIEEYIPMPGQSAGQMPMGMTPAMAAAQNMGTPAQVTTQNMGTPAQAATQNMGAPTQAAPRNMGTPAQAAPMQAASQNTGAPAQAMPQNRAQSWNTPPSQGAAAQSPQQIAATIDKKLPVEQIYNMLTRDIAAAVVVNIGSAKGKTLGQVAVEKPASISWYANDYKGSDNLLRAASRFLLDAAYQQAG
ncbi:MAG: hypothetical protein IJ716_14960 [Lachnospiraceae bacterium]|nr:hypothetical protein [Lachnospiraceae bacterium]